MVTPGRDAQLEAARRRAEEYFEAALTEPALAELGADTRGWSWTGAGRLFVTGLISRLAESRCAHLDGLVPQPAFGLSWRPGLACVTCAGPGGDRGFDAFEPEVDARCAACGTRGSVLAAQGQVLATRQILRGVYVVVVFLCPECEGRCRDD